MDRAAPVSVIETSEFQSAVNSLLSDDERMSLIDYVAHNPTAGVVIPGGGGVRKMRWAIGNKGKRGGARVIYFFHDRGNPIYMLTAFAKSRQVDISPAQREAFGLVTKALSDNMTKGGR